MQRALAVLLAAAGLQLGCESTPLLAPGTPTRPQLDARGAERYAVERVLGSGGTGRAPVADGWQPWADRSLQAESPPALHYRVDPAAADGRRIFASVQGAINQAHIDTLAGRHAGQARLTIGIAPGRYAEPVYVPATPLPITLWGLGREPPDVRIEYAIDAGMPAAEYAGKLRGIYEAPGIHADIAAIYRQCSSPTATRTSCSAVMWIANDGFQLRRVTVANSYDHSRVNAPAHQAVAFKSEGADRVHLEQVHLLGFQDTLYLRTKGGDHIARTFVRASLIEGDVDFIFGAGTAYFVDSEIRSVGSRRGVAGGYVGAPSTSYHVPYGLVFEGCRFTSTAGSANVALARQWFAGARCSPYGEAGSRCRIDGANTRSDAQTLPQLILETVGKMAVLRSDLGPHLLPQPWVAWQADRRAPNHRPAQLSSDDFWRNLEAAGIVPASLGYARREPPEPYLTEYANRGPGSGRHQPGIRSAIALRGITEPRCCTTRAASRLPAFAAAAADAPASRAAR